MAFDYREDYIKAWAKMLGCNNDVYSVAAQLINKNKNFQSACAVLMNLSFRTHKEYLVKCSKYLETMWKGYGDTAVCNADWIYKFQQHYINEVDSYPKDAT